MTRTRGSSATLSPQVAAPAVGEHLYWEGQDVNGFGDETGESRLLEPCAIRLHDRCRQRDDGDRRCGCVLFQLAGGVDAVNTGQGNVHQHEVRKVLARHRDAILAIQRLDRAESVKLQNVAGQLQVLVVVLHDENQGAVALCHGAHADTGSASGASSCGDLVSIRCSGNETVKVLPAPGVLSTVSSPPCRSTS